MEGGQVRVVGDAGIGMAVLQGLTEEVDRVFASPLTRHNPASSRPPVRL